MNTLFRPLGSIRLAVFLLITLALVAVVGTVVPQGLRPQDYQRLFPGGWQTVTALGFDRFYTGWVYRGLLSALAINLFACAFRRSAAGWHASRGRGTGTLRVRLDDRSVWTEALRRDGFRVADGPPLVAQRRRWAFLGFPLVHLAPFLIMAGALWGSLAGYVGTRNVYVGSETRSADQWPARAPSALPFTLTVRSFRLFYHPIGLRLRVVAAQGASPLLETREGASVDVPETPYRVFVQTFDPSNGDLVYFVDRGAGSPRLGPFSRGKEDGAPVRVRPDAFRDLQVRRAEALVALSDGAGGVLAEREIAVNEPLSYRGYRIYLTSWSEDVYQNPYVGLQITRDPGQGLVWSGAVALSLGLLLLLFGDGAWAREEGGELWLRGSRGRASLRGLLAGDQELRGQPSSRQQWGSGASNDPDTAKARAVQPPRQSP
ncbi:MAG: cytochrome c biogenesis protein ResB [Deltaproteobacteria bacterium]|nr:cytochrome c biogenesis protein ResB [Deltaproteobacteria bacterium]